MINFANKKYIHELFNKEVPHWFLIPKYQREYTWGYKEWDVLYDDLMENDEGYFIGSIIYINTNEAMNPRFEVIDGQQRLTTLYLLLAAIYKTLEKHKDDLDEDDRDEISMLKKSLKSRHSDNHLMIMPQVQNSNLADFNALMYELGIGDFAKKPGYAGARKIYRCYNHFLWLIKHDLDERKEESISDVLLRTKRKVLNAMVVSIEVSTHSDAYVMFESLNHRGTPLTAIDLMKNLIMAKAERHGLTCDECFDKWQNMLQYLPDNYAIQERFFRHYYNAFKNRLNAPFRKEEERKKDPLGVVATKSNLLSIYEKLINKNLPEFLDDIVCCAAFYNEMLYPEVDDNHSDYSAKLAELLHVQAAPSYLLIMYLMRNRETLSIDNKTLTSIIDSICLFFIRRNVTDTPNTRDITRLLMEIIGNIEEKGFSGSAVRDYIIETLKSVSASDEYFRKKLEGDIYRENVDAARYLLCSLAEKHMTRESWTDLWKRNNNDVYVWTIEHIFPEGENIPQEWIDMIAAGDKDKANEYREKFVHKIGNLTMTGYNSKLSNYSFEKKRDRKSQNKDRYIGYKNGLEINRELAEKDSWTIEDIQQRTQVLVAEILEMFKI